jgi:hypothetical protein
MATPTRSDGVPIRLDLAERGGREMNHRSFHAFVANEYVRAGAEQPDRNTLGVSSPQDFGQFANRGWFGKVLGSPAKPKPIPRDQGFVFADTVFKTS